MCNMNSVLVIFNTVEKKFIKKLIPDKPKPNIAKYTVSTLRLFNPNQAR